MGFMMENRIPSLKCDSDVFVTFVGDNMAMLQVVIRELLTQYTKLMGNNLVMGLIRNWTSSVSDSLRTSFLGFSVDKVGDLMFLLKAVEKSKDEFFMAWNACLHHVTTLAMAHRHRVTLEQFALAVRQCHIKEDRALLTKFCLHSTSLVYQERAWYLEHNYMTLNTSRQIRSQLLELKVVDDFNIPSCCIQAPIAGVACPRTEWAFNPQPQYPSSTQPQSKL